MYNQLIKSLISIVICSLHAEFIQFIYTNVITFHIDVKLLNVSHRSNDIYSKHLTIRSIDPMGWLVHVLCEKQRVEIQSNEYTQIKRYTQRSVILRQFSSNF